ncbi:MAG: transglycosylase domain-containing protein, partial [Spirochaetia bacterium]|nr:transglycosylase domain-containing protein [Spirochaetia bacterium]
MASGNKGTFRPVLVVFMAIALLIGALLGIGLGSTLNILRNENFSEFTVALPSKLYDIKGRLITEFYAEEKRDPVPLKDLPPALIGAFLTREDQSFYSHHGFTLKGLARAFIGKIIGKNLGGGSTITQQLAGTLYADRRDISLRRKIVELWWALQLERRYTKNEILEMYLNRMVMGPGVYGVEAASQYFFGHSARECTPAEAAILAIQLSSPSKYNPFKNPANAQARSRDVLDQMVSRRIISKSEAQTSYNAFWDNFDYTRVVASAYFMRQDKAPWFSEYVRRQLEDMLYGSLDLYSDGLSIYTTLDLDAQEAADAYMKRGIEQANASFRRASQQRFSQADNSYTPIVEMLGLVFDLKPLFVSTSKNEFQTYETYRTKLNPVVDAMSLMFGLSDLKALSNASTASSKKELEKTIVEGSLVTIDNQTGYITALIGGSDYNMSNQLIRATQAKLMPGSTFKPLYYSAAIDSGKLTEGTLIYDAPTIFYNEDGTPYIPLNFKGEWKGKVLAWQALAKSMNVPSVKVLDMIGFDAAIQRAAALLGITDPKEIQNTFPRLYPLALGVIGVTPLQMAKAFSTFATGGISPTPIAIRYVEDRNGTVILEPEKDAREAQKRQGSKAQVISPQNAAVMTDMLQRVVASGTLAGATGSGSIFKQTDDTGKTY